MKRGVEAIARTVVQAARVRELVGASQSQRGPVVYWMSRDQRASDNWALLYASARATEVKAPLLVCFALSDPLFPGANWRSLHFMLHGLKEVAASLNRLNIEFRLLRGEPPLVVAEFLKTVKASLLVCDQSPLRIGKLWKQTIVDLQLPHLEVQEVDAHNVVPVWKASDKQETAARTIRPKLWNLAPRFLEPFPQLEKHEFGKAESDEIDPDAILASLKDLDRSVEPVGGFPPGTENGMERMRSFFERIKNYSNRNKIDQKAQSDLSPYLHFGQISAQRVIMEAISLKKNRSALAEAVDEFVEEIFVRRELADNFCFYNPKYDSIDGAADWAKETLKLHEKDKRQYVYSLEQFERALTHDKLWNAAQNQMVTKGKMHGFCRMYWCKKILEWAETPAEALRIGIYLNDKYNLDGRDPNGYVGVMWSVCGVHDMGFAERPVFGKIRFMNYEGCLRKFKQSGIDAFIKDNPPRGQGAIDKFVKTKK